MTKTDGVLPFFDVVCHTASLQKCDVIESYKISEAAVYITNQGQYLISEPQLSAEIHLEYNKIMQQLFLSLEPIKKSDDPVNYIERHIWRQAEKHEVTKIVSKEFSNLRYYLVRDLIGWGILDVVMKDKNIEEITAERFDTTIGVIHRKYAEFHILDTNIKFDSRHSMNSYIQKITQRAGKNLTAAYPVVDFVSSSGDRITVTYDTEVSLPGPTITVRKFSRDPFTIIHLIQMGSLNVLMASYIWMLLDAKAFGLIVGETGCGKTTAVNAIIELLNPRWKFLTIEETPELKISKPRWIRLLTRTTPMVTSAENYDISIMDLIKASLRMRPDFEIVGEVRSSEAQFLFQSAATGHGGLTTFHSSDVESALNRLASEPINIKASQLMLVWFVAHMTRIKSQDKKIQRKFVNIQEVIPKPGSVELIEVFRFDKKTNSFEPSNITDLIKKSKRINVAANYLNVDVETELRKRIEVLNEFVSKPDFDASKISSKYYFDSH